ncbi:hypothetical protein PGTUg99_000671 [Puccinia graminis f. sp. tritici]|uniref:Uncharacterized protein n=1 Tax=Puccinia graminis f. sp. tritici TaxID=56615 RepID=A0A5B0SJY2_PUCGR|nr:hypothetical protein PGTUg99_000671 [Puccinia graminis f. sp. tritici]
MINQPNLDSGVEHPNKLSYYLTLQRPTPIGINTNFSHLTLQRPTPIVIHLSEISNVISPSRTQILHGTNPSSGLPLDPMQTLPNDSDDTSMCI